MKHWWSLLQINSLNVSRSLCLLKFLTKIGKDALSEVYVCQAWHIAIHSSLMCQGPPTAKPLLLLHRLLITVDKHAGGDPPPLLHPHQLRLERYATSRKFWLGSFAQFLTPSKISKNDKVIKRKLQNNPHLWNSPLWLLHKNVKRGQTWAPGSTEPMIASWGAFNGSVFFSFFLSCVLIPGSIPSVNTVWKKQLRLIWKTVSTFAGLNN